MFTSAPSPPNLATSAPIAAPRSPVRPSRLRGLSYLRNYTHSHLHSRDTGGTSPTSSRNLTLTRATSYPSPTIGTTTSGASESVSTPSPRSPRPSPSIQRSAADSNSHIAAQDSTGNTSGWLPSTGGQSGVSRVAVLSGAGGTVEDIPYTADMGRTRSATTSRMAGADISSMNGGVDPQLQYSSTAPKSTSGFGASLPSIRFSQHQDIRAPRPSLVFSPMSRTLPTGKEVIRVGRYSEREQPPVTSASTPSAAAVGFKSKVVSRRHCEFWSEGGTWYIKDVKSSSGTFLNHVRLSSPGIESKPFAVKDGDIVQLGIDFKGGEEMIFRCVKIRVELNRNWQSALNSFNVASHKRLRNMAQQGALSPASASSSQDCSICLSAIAPCQSLFVAPCSHTWHYKCVRPILEGIMYPQFICPNCRAVADLEAEVDDPYADGDWEEVDADEVDAPAQPIETALPVEPVEPVQPVQPVQPLEPVPGAAAVLIPRMEEFGQDPSTDESEPDLQHIEAESNVKLSTESEPSLLNTNTSTLPVDIPRRSISHRRSEDHQEYNASETLVRNERTPSPVDGAQANGSEIGPMTPRNDVGPFVFDGSAGRAGPAGVTPMAALREPMSLAAVSNVEVSENTNA